jgi:hypothetical protein
MVRREMSQPPSEPSNLPAPLSSDASFGSFFANRRGAWHLPVQIQTGEQFTALADSGAELPLINRQLAQQLHLDIFRAKDKVSWTDINKKKST